MAQKTGKQWTVMVYLAGDNDLDSAGVAVMESRLQAQSYDTPDYVDLYDFCALLEEKSANTDIKSACGDVKNVIRPGGMVIASGYKGANVNNSNGLSIYFPQKNISPLYGTLDFTKKTAWENFCRNMRLQPGDRGGNKK